MLSSIAVSTGSGCPSHACPGPGYPVGMDLVAKKVLARRVADDVASAVPFDGDERLDSHMAKVAAYTNASLAILWLRSFRANLTTKLSSKPPKPPNRRNRVNLQNLHPRFPLLDNVAAAPYSSVSAFISLHISTHCLTRMP